MFEVGKCYKHSNGFSVYECLAAIGDVGWMKEEDHIPCTIHWSSQWFEYHEPVVVKVIRAVVQNKDGGLCTPRPEFVNPNDNVVGKIEVTVTDGKLTDARIL